MIFVEFVSSNYPRPGAKHYFVGVDLGAILADTQGGEKFGFANFTSHQEITEEGARGLKLGFLDEGISSVNEGTSTSFKLKTPG